MPTTPQTRTPSPASRADLDAALNELRQAIALQSLVTARRLHALRGRELTLADVTIDANWGTGATRSIVAGSNDQRGAIDVVTGTTPGTNPQVTITFRDGAWPVAPHAIVKKNDSQSQQTTSWVASTTQLIITHVAVTPATGTHRFAYLLIG